MPRNAKIIATLGPASSSLETIRDLFLQGVNVFRLNFSHGSYEEHRERVNIIRQIEKQYNTPIAILQDLQGPKLRVGSLANDTITLTKGQSFRLDLDATPGDQDRVQLPHPEIFAALSPGEELLLVDGKLRLKVDDCGSDCANTTVLFGGSLSSKQGVNVPGIALPISALTEKDREDLKFGLELGVDWVALSFVQRAQDIEEARQLINTLKPTGAHPSLIAKLEKPQAIEDLENIVALADGILVARGDLGVEMPLEEVPVIQKRILTASRKAGKPVAVATQMLESMIHAPTPTRAEVSDVATAIYDGADAVMLSAESASGSYPVEAVNMMRRIIEMVEQDPLYRVQLEASGNLPEATAADAITVAARQVAHTLNAAAIVTFSSSGATTLRAARERPKAPILNLTPHVSTARKLCLVWGVQSIIIEVLHNFEKMIEFSCDIAQKSGFAKKGDHLVVTAGVPFAVAGATNVLRIVQMGNEGY